MSQPAATPAPVTPKPKKSVALSGVPAGNTALCTVGRTGNDLHYRGYDILDIAENAEFEEIRSTGTDMALYPLSAFRAMNQAALNVYGAIRKDGHQRNVVDTMQTRDDLYRYLGYHDYERKLDALFQKAK